MTILAVPLALNWMRGLRFLGHIEDAKRMPASTPKISTVASLITVTSLSFGCSMDIVALSCWVRVGGGRRETGGLAVRGWVAFRD